MKKFLSVITVTILVVAMLCSTNLLSFASISASSGRGLVDGAKYYIYNSTYDNGYSVNGFMHTDSDVLNIGGVRVTLQDCYSNYSPHWFYDYFKWTVHKQSDGTYLVEGINELYLKIQTDESVVIHYNLGGDEYKFEICRVDGGAYDGMYTIKNDGKFLSINSTSEGIYELELIEEESVGSYWTFMAAEAGNFRYYGYNTGTFNTTNIYDLIGEETIDQYFSNYQYNSHVRSTPISSSEVISQMQDSDITILAGLGGDGYVITNPNGTVNSLLMADYELTSGYTQQYINELGYNDLAKSRCIIYASSHSGKFAIGNDGEQYNLVDRTYQCGAHFVLGFVKEMPQNLIKTWLSCFVFYINYGFTIYEAMVRACDYTGLYDPTIDGVERYDQFIYYRGDANQYLNLGITY